MKSIRTRMTVIFVGLMMAMIAVIWGINKWYLEKYYITEKVESIEAAYDAFNWQLESNAERGISIQEAMKREQDADGNIKEGNLQKLFRDFSDKANVSMLMIDKGSYLDMLEGSDEQGNESEPEQETEQRQQREPQRENDAVGMDTETE